MVGKNDFGVEFFDVPENQVKLAYHPKIHHFRSSNISTVTRMLDDHWSTILKNNIPIPTHKLLVGDLNDIPQIIETTFLSGKVENIVILSSPFVNEIVECPENGLEEKCNDLEILFLMLWLMSQMHCVKNLPFQLATMRLNI